MQTIFNIVITVLVFGVLILSHEAGHFFTAVWAKIKIHEFSVGMGPALYQRQGKLCLFSVRALPIGGFVQMEGEDGESDDENAFSKKPKWKRFLVLVMGATMNIVMGFLLICIIYATCFSAFPSTIVAKFNEDAVSSSHGLQEEDKILSIDGYRIFTYTDISYALSRNSKAEHFDITVSRKGKQVQLENVVFPKIEVQNTSFFDTDFKVYGLKKNPINVLRYSIGSTISISRSIYSFIGSIFTMKADYSQVSGPVGTASAIGESATTGGLPSLLMIVAMISINLGIMNLLPFPALDGGRILLLLIEAIRRKPLNPKVETWINAAGLVILMGIMLLVTAKDIINLF